MIFLLTSRLCDFVTALKCIKRVANSLFTQSASSRSRKLHDKKLSRNMYSNIKFSKDKEKSLEKRLEIRMDEVCFSIN